MQRIVRPTPRKGLPLPPFAFCPDVCCLSTSVPPVHGDPQTPRIPYLPLYSPFVLAFFLHCLTTEESKLTVHTITSTMLSRSTSQLLQQRKLGLIAGVLLALTSLSPLARACGDLDHQHGLSKRSSRYATQPTGGADLLTPLVWGDVQVVATTDIVSVSHSRAGSKRLIAAQ